MRKILKIFVLILTLIILICGYSFLTDKTSLTKWNITYKKSNTSGISWSKFYWAHDSISGRLIEKTAMLIPCTIDGLPNKFILQFDLGDNVTEIYEKSFNSFAALHPKLTSKIQRLKSPLQFWNTKKIVSDISIEFGNIRINTKNAFLYKDYGEEYNNIKNDSTEYRIGTLGADVFQNKVLVIDYPNQRFAICENVPEEYKKISFVNTESDNAGRLLLPMEMRGKKYKVMFDNGSSLFQLSVSDKRIKEFSILPDTDTLQIYAWGKKVKVTGRPLHDSFTLGGQIFSNITVYAVYTEDYLKNICDAMTGNKLFLDKIIIIDFRNKKFGVK